MPQTEKLSEMLCFFRSKGDDFLVKTITVDGSEEIVLSSEPYFYKSEKYAWIKNRSSDEMSASADNENFISIPAGLSGRIEILHGNKIFITGSGDAEIHTSDVSFCPFGSGILPRS